MRVETLGGLTARVTGGTDGRGGGDGPVVVLLHGFGAPGEDLVALGPALGLPEAVRFVFPAAPLTLDDVGMYGGRAWWMIDMERLQLAIMTGRARDLTKEVPEGLPAAREQVHALLDDVENRLGAPSEDVVLGGFSQGAMLSCDLALRSDRPLRGLALLSGTFLCEHEWRPCLESDQRRGLRAFQSHGVLDPLLPFELAEKLRDALVAAGVDLTWVAFRGGHEIPHAVLAKLQTFLRGVLAAPPPPP
jgi:phospholipase/carboxylesterase